MTLRRSFIALFLGLAALPAMAAEVRSQPSAAEILKLVIANYGSGKPHLTGRMLDNNSGKEDPFDLTRSAEAVVFRFDNPTQIVSLDLTTSPATLREGKTDKLSKVPASRYGEQVRGFDLTYEDLSMSFLYWPDTKILRDDTLKGGVKAWVVRVISPDGKGPYGTVDVWVHKDSGAMAKMEAWDRKGLRLRKFEISTMQGSGENYVPKAIRLETHAGDKGRTGSSQMIFDKPSKN